MSIRFVRMAAMGLIASCAGIALGQPAYSFENVADGGGPPGPDGFFGLGATIAQESVIGVTHLDHSLRYDTGISAFVGARTELVPPSLNNPPGVEYVLLDLNVPEIPDGLTFADIGVTIFGHDYDNAIFGVQCQFVDTVSITALGVGQHNDVRIDLDADFFTGRSFNDLFGDDVADLDVASAFQLYISKNSGVRMTVFVDNVRFVVPAPGTIAMCSVGTIVLGSRRRRTASR